LVGAPVSPSASPTPSSPATPKADATPSETFLQQAASPEGIPDPIDTPTIDLKEEIVEELGKLVSQIWIEGDRHDMALSIAGWFARTGVKESCTKKIVEIASQLNKGDTKHRLKDVVDTYRNLNIKPIKGKKHIQNIIEEKHPEGPVRASYEKLLRSINAKLPRPKGHRKDQQPVDFKLLHLTKFNSIPARWTVLLEKELTQYTTILDNSRFSKYENFVDDVLEQNSLALTANLKKHEWMTMIHEAIDNGLYEEKAAPVDSRPAGAIEQGLQEFMAESRENPDVGLLKKFAGHDDDTTFFLPHTFKTFLDDQGNKFSPHQISEKLKDMGWQKKPRRFGKKVPQVWIRSIVKGGGGNGNGNGNGHGHPGDGAPLTGGGSSGTTTPETIPAVNPGPEVSTLFPEEGSDA